MADKVQADYDQLAQVAGQFANQSQAVQELIQKVRSSYQQLEDGGWIGLGADAFFDAVQTDLFPAVQRLQDAFDKASETTNKIAQDMQDAEDQSQQLFRI